MIIFTIFLIIASYKETSRIIGGTLVAPFGDFWSAPWQVRLLNSDSLHGYCGGVLLNTLVVMSAGHCLESMRGDGKDMVLIGTNNLLDAAKDEFKHKIKTVSIRVHPKYERFEKFTYNLFKKEEVDDVIYDFMLFALMNPVSFPSHYYARLPTENLDDDELKGQSLLSTGWGNMLPMTRKNIIDKKRGIPVPQHEPNDLMETTLKYLPKSICQKRYKKHLKKNKNVKGKDMEGIHGPNSHVLGDVNFENELGDSMMCTSYCDAENIEDCNTLERRGQCFGDSGCKFISVRFK